MVDVFNEGNPPNVLMSAPLRNALFTKPLMNVYFFAYANQCVCDATGEDFVRREFFPLRYRYYSRC